MSRASNRRSPLLAICFVVPLTALLWGLGGGCASVGGGQGSSQGAEFLEEANGAIVMDNPERAYVLLKRIRSWYPESPESDKAFAPACRTFQRLWYQRRFSASHASWLESEQDFMFDWLTSYFDGESFPYEKVNLLLSGLPLTAFRAFQEFGRARPEVSRWSMKAYDDNGIIQLVTAARADEPASGSPVPTAAPEDPSQPVLPPVAAAPPGTADRPAAGITLIDVDVAGGPDGGTGDMTWGPGLPLDISTSGGPSTAPCPIVLDRPIFVKDGRTLKILPGCVVRGQPRSAPVRGGAAGRPGALIVTRSGRIDAVGTASAPIIFTTAAVDNDDDGVADDSEPPARFPDRWDPYASPPDVFLDDDPLRAPLAPLDANGDANVSLWGGIVILGRAPTNLANNAGAWGTASIEGLSVAGFPQEDAVYGGDDPHHSSGRLAFASIRHAGDEIGAGNELNCLSLGGVGDGTLLSHVECYASYDDGFEWFGGTVHGDHLVVTMAGDDAFDVDQGYTGVNQFLFVVMPTFNEDDGEPFGSASGDHAAEFDGDDRGNANSRIDMLDGNTDRTCWPLSNPAFYNLTVLGPAPQRAGAAPGDNPAASPRLRSGGLLLRNGFAGKVYNALILNTGGGPGLEVDADRGEGGCARSDTGRNVEAGRVAVVSSSFQGVAAVPGYVGSAGRRGTSGEADVLLNGNALAARGAAEVPRRLANRVNVRDFAGLESDVAWLDPKGNAQGKLDASLLAAPIDPQPRPGGVAAAGVKPEGPGIDASATFRGAFRPGAPSWTAGWTALSNAGLLADD